MREIDEGRLADLALGLSDDPELREALDRSAELRARFGDITSAVGRLDKEFGQMLAQRQRSTRKLSPEPWSILLAIDDSEPAQRAASSAVTLAQASDGEVVVLHLREIAPVKMGQSLETSAEAARMVENVAAALRDLGAAELLHPDLIVMGSRGFFGLAGVFFGSVSQKTLQRAPCPVLVVR
jgi:nucleotide-binding universal stress UspA family protein